MRAIERTSRFKRDYRREKSGVLSKKLDQLLIEAIDLLAADRSLPQRYFDHPLSGEWSGFRDCHIRPDLVLIYEKPDAPAPRPPRLAQRAGILNSGFADYGLLSHSSVAKPKIAWAVTGVIVLAGCPTVMSLPRPHRKVKAAEHVM